MVAISNKYQRFLKGEYVPVYMTFGGILMSTSLGLFTAMKELVTAPNVMVSKRKRKEIPEVEEPEYVLDKSEAFVSNSIFRRLAKNSGSYEDLRRRMSSGLSFTDRERRF
ncbi:hypothetical protein SUGI_0578810 [Cryptomeria japonica]|uniref:uncharacterized protein LOC131077513 n=1 Tax=Cryptomeria japonica TaxID=3369 RepID=UPI002414BC64|nr:uncharacterized protein LOC131077513 [Cryptomeria japonica]GLJ29346.1 hypothetical protein SUGI_0578810 [Cryptomeria japonica]